METPTDRLGVEVVYATTTEADVSVLALAPGATVRDAVEASGVLRRHPEIDAGALVAGIHGRVRALDDRLADADRVEIYRPLEADPKQARRQRVRAARNRRA